MHNNDTMDAFMEELKVCSAPYRKGIYAPFCKIVDDIAKLMLKYNLDDVGEIVSNLPEYGIEVINIKDDQHLPAGSSAEEIKHKYIQIIEKNELDTELLYYLGEEEVARKYPEMFEKLVEITFFADKNLVIGIPATQQTQILLKAALEEKHFELHPEDIERAKGWVDEDTAAFLRPYVKAEYVPSRIVTEAIRNLMIDYGDFPMCQNIVIQTLTSMNVQSIIISNYGSIEPTSDEAELQQRMTNLLKEMNFDFEASYQNGMESINQDIFILFRNQYFFVDERVKTFHETDRCAILMMSKILKDEHDRIHYDEAGTQDSVDSEMLNALRVYEKNGYVPTWIVMEHEARLRQKYGNFADAEKVRIDTLAAVPAQAIALEKNDYMQPGSRWRDVRAVLKERISKWDLEKAFVQNKVPDLNHQDYIQLAAMIYFAMDQIDNLSEANSAFMDVFTEMVAHDRISRYPDDLPMSARREVENIVAHYSKNGAVPSFIQDQCLAILSDYLKPNWYAEQMYTDILDAAGVHVLELWAEDYVAPGASKEDIEAKVQQLVTDANLDLDFYVHHDCCSDADNETKRRAIHLVYFADDDIESEDAAATCADTIIFSMSLDYLEEHYPNEAQANKLFGEMNLDYSKDGLIPSWTRAYLEQRLAEAKVSDWMVENILNLYDGAYEGGLVSLDQEDTYPNGTDPNKIKEKIVSIATRYQFTANQILQCLRNREVEFQLGAEDAVNTIRYMVLFADKLSETLDDVDERIVAIMTE